MGLSVYSHIKHIWKKLNLKDQFGTVDAAIDEIKNIRYLEHKRKAKIVTPFIGRQLKVCKYFELEIPKGCGL
ncbi:MAG: hypothetical protein LKE40_12965 [Spirochaetia bacterium]|nr:hypothetical protein [Spirochaetia bacterium]